MGPIHTISSPHFINRNIAQLEVFVNIQYCRMSERLSATVVWGQVANSLASGAGARPPKRLESALSPQPKRCNLHGESQKGTDNEDGGEDL